MTEARERVAVVGAGVAGITAAYLLDRKYDVTLFEKSDKIGGHTNTFLVEFGPDRGMAIDTGFIVLNDKTYPNLHKLLLELGVKVRYSDMSFGFHSDKNGFNYSGRGVSGLFSQRSNFFKRRHWQFLSEILVFCKKATLELSEKKFGNDSLRDFFERHKFSNNLRDDYVIPMAAAIWSARAVDILDFPLATFLHFFSNHGLLSLADRPKWQTVVGGSYQYLEAFKKKFQGKIRTCSSILSISRNESQTSLQFPSGAEDFRYVVIATHANQVLPLLSQATPDESRLISAWKYQKNHTVLHTDSSFLPPNRRAWAAWNYRREMSSTGDEPLSVTYYMNLLQGLKTRNHYCVTLNSDKRIDARKILMEIDYEHPIYDLPAYLSQKELHRLQGTNSTYFCGSYFGFGFHEDAVTSGVNVARLLGVEW